ncbi:MAG: hypothetical protein K0S38_491 [Candidatus Paceibacter sp.]|jgi:hypothetical protein|nr:hypothetical protein [Candidatus Paceibacter sp.]
MHLLLISDKDTDRVVGIYKIDSDDTIVKAFILPNEKGGKAQYDAPTLNKIHNDNEFKLDETMAVLSEEAGLVEIPPYQIKSFGILE